MNWEDLILKKMSLELVDYLIQEIEDAPSLFEELFPLLFSDNEKMAWRTGWILCHMQKKTPFLLEPKLAELIEYLPQTRFHGVRRSILFVIFNSNYKDFSVDFINQCFEWMLSPKQDVAIQMYSMYCLEKVCVVYPDFKPELIASLETIDPQDYSKGLNSVRNKILKKLIEK